MRQALRWLFRNLVLVFVEEWDKACQDRTAGEAVHALDALYASELSSFRSFLRTVEQLHHEAARAVVRFPGAKGRIVDALEKRLDQLPELADRLARDQKKAA